jgi:hypothetical protein
VPNSGITVYLVAALIGLLSAAAAMVIPLWRRGGMAEVRRQARPLVRLFAGLVIFLVAIILANAIGLGPAVNLVLAVASIVVAILWLRPGDARNRLSPRLRAAVWLALALSVVLFLIAVMSIATR